MLLLLFAVFTVSEFKISHLNALLRFKDPNSDRLPHFTLSAEGSCMNWTSLNSNIVKVTPIYDYSRCSKSALVEVVTTGPNRKSTQIIVEDSNGQSRKCDVFVDSVASISILTTTRSIYIESSLETLYLQALDSEKNIFTSLEGTYIDWKIDTEHLRVIDPSKAKVTSQSSSISHPKSSAQLIIQGTNVGKTWVSAVLDNKFKSDVELTVVEPIALFPQPIVRVLPHTHIPYKLCSTRGSFENEKDKKCVSQISLPSETNYRIETSDQDVITTDQSAYVTVNGVGTATVVAIDQHMNDNTASSVVIASYPKRYIQEEQYIALGDNPKFNPVLYDRDDQEYNYFEKVNWTIIGDWNTVGRKEITLKYHDYSLIAIVHVCPPLTVTPEKALLPKNYNGYPLKVSGGSGKYNAKVESSNILTLENGRIVNTKNNGKSRIIFNDARISKFSASVEIEVSPIGLIDIQLENRETINQPFQPKCEVFATGKRKFSVEVTYKEKSSNLSVVSNSLFPVNTGFSDIYCESGESHSEYLKVSVASNLKAEVDGIASPNSIVPLKITGGVLRWPFADEDPTINIQCPNSNSKIYENNRFSIDHEFTGMCTITMQNKQSPQNPHPLLVEAKLEVKFHKVDQFAMHLIDLSNQNLLDSRCKCPPPRIVDPKEAKQNFNIVLNHQYKIIVYAIDANNDLIKYYSADRFTIQPNTPQEILPINRQKDFESDLSTQFLITPKQATNITLVPLENQDTKSNSLNLNTISDFSVKGSNLLYFHTRKSYEYLIDGGSGIFETRQSDAHFQDSKLYLDAKMPGNYKIDVKDVCNPNYLKNIEVELISVYKLSIEAPTLVAYNTEFDAIVKAYDKDGRPLPQSMYDEADIHISNDIAQKIGYNTWRINASTNEKLTITAIAENGVTANHIVDIAQSIIVSPQYIELLPGETQRVTVVCGPSDLSFDDGLSKIASFNSQTYDILAITPGRVTINVTAKDITGLSSFPIYVHVIRPIDLKITPSSDHVVQYGKLMLSVIMETDTGFRSIDNAKWDIPNDFLYDMINNSLVVVQCSDAKQLTVGVSAYGLSNTYSVSIEPKLKILTPQEIYIPTYCSFKIQVENDLDCQFSSLDSSVVSIDSNGKGLIFTNETEGDAIVLIKYGHQFLTVNVKVSNPKQFYIMQSQSTALDYKFTVLNPEGYEYTTTQCLNYDLYVKDKETNDVHIAKETQSQNDRIYSITSQRISFDHPLEIVASISNHQFTLKNAFLIASSNSITPTKPIFLNGFGKQMQCTVSNPNWIIHDTSIASVTSKGFVTAKKAGHTHLSCAGGVSTTITVLDVNKVKIDQEPTNNANSVNYKVDLILSDSTLMSQHPNIIKPDDFHVRCDLDINSQTSGCGTVSHTTRNGQNYCIFTPNTNKVCPRQSSLHVTVNSESLGIHLKGQSLLPKSNSYSNDNSKFSYDSYEAKTQVYVSKDQPTIEVPVDMKSENTDIHTSRGLSARFDSYGGVVIIKADNDFGPSGRVELHDKSSGERYIIEVIGDLGSNTRRSTLKGRQVSFSTKEIYFFTLIALLFGIVYTIVYFCYE